MDDIFGSKPVAKPKVDPSLVKANDELAKLFIGESASSNRVEAEPINPQV
jgi:hypothetical protein